MLPNRVFRLAAGKIRLPLMLALVAGLLNCRTTEPPPLVYTPESQAAPKAALVSILPSGSSSGDIVVKTSPTLKTADWQLTGQSAAGVALKLDPVETTQVQVFTLNTFRATGLTLGQTYRFRLRFVYNNRDTLTVDRTYRHATPAYWRGLADLPMETGDFTGSLLLSQSTSGGDFTGYVLTGGPVALSISAVRYLTDDQWEASRYDINANRWLPGTVPDLVAAYVPRHQLVRFRLLDTLGLVYVFNGLGFLYRDQLPHQRAYQNTMFVRDNTGVHQISYAGEDGEVAFFQTANRAFQLTQNGSPALWVRRGNWREYRGADLPEAPGTLATFVINDTAGYVISQHEGQPPHLYAYNPDTNQWTRRTDFPGTTRSRGVSFSVAGKGYFGLGVTGEDERGLRDLWQYDPATDRWQYVTDYPGQGHRYLISYSLSDRAYIGWGYESQLTPPDGARQVGCTDFWEFKP